MEKSPPLIVVAVTLRAASPSFETVTVSSSLSPHLHVAEAERLRVHGDVGPVVLLGWHG